MINTNKLKGIMAEQCITGQEMANRLGMAPKTFYDKMKKGVFGSDEIDGMIEILSIEDPVGIFFAQLVN